MCLCVFSVCLLLFALKPDFVYYALTLFVAIDSSMLRSLFFSSCRSILCTSGWLDVFYCNRSFCPTQCISLALLAGLVALVGAFLSFLADVILCCEWEISLPFCPDGFYSGVVAAGWGCLPGVALAERQRIELSCPPALSVPVRSLPSLPTAGLFLPVFPLWKVSTDGTDD